ncbi:MAG: hypothetical protein NTU74_00410 [Deltaproteobacteria bacterium]|nr:hypothetical protein [Deltaproteobacteria bacterium]
MKQSFEKIYGEISSPLFRIMAGYDIANTNLRRFENNICSFHVGNGVFLSVSHNLIFFNNIPRSLTNADYNQIIAASPQPIQQIIQQNYVLDPVTNKFRWNENPQNAQQLLQLFPQIAYDTRYPNLYSKNICKPYLLLQFQQNAFIGNQNLNGRFTNGRYFYEPDINRHTFLVDLILHKIIVSSDIAIYKINEEFSDLFPFIPSIEIDFNIYDIGDSDFYCLQGAPINELGRLLHKSQIEGYIDHFSSQLKFNNQNYIFEGNRYLIKGYFRFGSSGAPYLHYDQVNDQFKVNAVQSEACPLQMMIQGNKDNNAQYVNAIATPLKNIQAELEPLL